MNKDKRSLTATTDTSTRHLPTLLDGKDLDDFKKLVPELRNNWVKRQMFRTETEMRISVLNDAKFGSNAAKYWQSVREQNAHFEEVMRLSFENRKNDVELKKLRQKFKEEKDPLERENIQITIEENIYVQASQQLEAQARMREIRTWSKLKKEFNDGTFNDQDVNQHQLDSYEHSLTQKKKTLTAGTSQPEVFNVLGQLATLERVKKAGEIKYDGTHRKTLSKKPGIGNKT